MKINDYLDSQLKQTDTTFDDFQKLLHRLLEKQVIYRSYNLTEARFYDLYVRNEYLVEEYLAVLGFVLVRHEAYHYIIAYPPGARIPAVREEELEHTAFIKRLKANEKILLIGLRSIYEEKLRTGDSNEKGQIDASIELIQTRFYDISDKHIPTSNNEKRDIFMTLKKLRLIEFEELDNEQNYVMINPSICHFVFDDFFKQIDALTSTEKNVDSNEEPE